MLSVEESRKRQGRLREIMAGHNLDAVVTAVRYHAYYFSAHLPFWQHEAAMIVFRDGPAVLIAAQCDPDQAAADKLVPFQAHFSYTNRQEQPGVVAKAALAELATHSAKRIGLDASAVTTHVALELNGSCLSIDEDLWQLRRVKGPDELALMKKAIECTEKMYLIARELIVPGVSELDVYGALHAAAVDCAGEPMSAWLGNDYRCAAMGGPPRGGHTAQSGEMYILDLGPAYRGYFADNARSFSVNGRPTAAQEEARATVLDVLARVESMARPGVSCRMLYDTADTMLKEMMGRGMIHHLGHGVGLQPHEYPHLNPAWDDTLLEGEVFTVEPGCYGPELGGGVRIENQYLVTAEGVENLVDAPDDL